MIFSLATFLALLPTYLIRLKWLGWPTTLLELLVAILVLSWLSVKVKSGLKLDVNLPRNLWAPLALFFVASLLAVATSSHTRAALGLWRAYFLEPFLVFIILLDQVKTKEQIKILLTGLAVSVAAVSLFAIFQEMTGRFIPFPWTEPTNFRVTSFFEYPNALALFLSPLLSLFLGLQIYWRPELRRWQSWTLWLVIILGSLALVFSKSVGGVGAFLVAAIFLLARQNKKVLIGTVLAAALAIALMSAYLWPAKLISTDVRLHLWQGTIRLIQHHPLAGSGLAGFPDLYKKYRLAPTDELFLYPHNIILNFWVELGLLGLLSFIWLIYEFFSLTKTGMLTLPVKAAMLALLVHGLIDVPYFKNDLAILFWLIVAMAIISQNLAQSPVHAQPRFAK
ncbi:O-antigen ligase family protein [Candidatus Uhrbacteria bacterium]|nr:O-antigen ligase family protein [Candidatus Uhrbacteria bacterium]